VFNVTGGIQPHSSFETLKGDGFSSVALDPSSGLVFGTLVAHYSPFTVCCSLLVGWLVGWLVIVVVLQCLPLTPHLAVNCVVQHRLHWCN
jgi:hypothetical protein